MRMQVPTGKLGYAEGLAKLVIYTCEEKKFARFQDNLIRIAMTSVGGTQDRHVPRELKATIRATFQTEAKLTHD